MLQAFTVQTPLRNGYIYPTIAALNFYTVA